MQPTMESFWRGSDVKDRRETYKEEYEQRKDDLESNAADTHRRICAVVSAFEAETNVQLSGRYASGWRPGAVNSKTPGAAKLSNHMLANAGDVEDTKYGEFAWWCYRNRHILEQLGLWMEHPCATVLLAKSTPWCHLQRLPPASNARIYHPTNASVQQWDKYCKAGGQPEGGPLTLRKGDRDGDGIKDEDEE